MAKIIIPITVDVTSKNVFPAIIAKQDDIDSRFLKVTFNNSGEPMSIASTSSVTINAQRADGASNSFAGEVNADGTVTVPITHWMLELDDTVKCDVSIIDTESRRLTSTLFYIEVEEAANDDGEISEEDEDYGIVVNLQGRVSSAEERLKKTITRDSTLAFDADGKLVYLSNVKNLSAGNFSQFAPTATEIIIGESATVSGGTFVDQTTVEKVYVYTEDMKTIVSESANLRSEASVEVIESFDYITMLVDKALGNRVEANEENIATLLKNDCTIGINDEGVIIFLSTALRFDVQEFTIKAPEVTTFVLGKSVVYVAPLAFADHEKVTNVFTFSEDLTASIAKNNENIAVAMVTKYDYITPLLKTISGLNAFKPVETSGDLEVGEGAYTDYINYARYKCIKTGNIVHCFIDVSFKAITTYAYLNLNGLPYTNETQLRDFAATSKLTRILWSIPSNSKTLTIINNSSSSYQDDETASFVVIYKTTS